MKSKASYFSISVPLVKENLRRFWAIPAIGFLAYFLSSVFPILMSYNHINDMYDYINMCLTNMQPFFMATHLLMPIITAVIVFRYIQNSSAVTAMHAMPFTRAQLFNSGVLSGLILILLPLLANEILLLAIAKPTYSYYMYLNNDITSSLLDNAVNIFTRTNVLQWFWQSLIIVLVIYAISIFAGMVTGNVVMHLALAFGFNFLAPSLYLSFISYCSSYLFGFTSTGAHEDILIGLSPYTQAFASQGSFSIGLQIYYIVLSIIILIVSNVLYLKRKMEKTGDSLVFNFMIPTICYLIAYFGMTLMGYYFRTLYNGTDNIDLYFYAGLAAGAVIAFIIGRMIVLKTPRIFDKYSIKSFAAYSLIAILFISCITLDLTGFENRVPNINKVKGVLSTNFDFTDNGMRYSSYLFKHTNSDFDYETFYYSDPKNIEALIGLHQDIVNNKKHIQEEEQNLNRRAYTLNLNYEISNPLGIARIYRLTHDRVKNNKYLKQIYESLEFKSYFSFNNLDYERITNINLNNIYFYDDYAVPQLLVTDKSKINELINAMEQDFQDRTYEEFINKKHPYCSLNIEYKYLDESQKLVENSLDLNVLLTDTNTIKWLKENGYSQNLECTADMINEIVFFERDINKEPITQNVKDPELYEDGEKKLVITDKKQIQEILDTHSSSETNYDKYYEGSIIFNPNIVDYESYYIYYDAEDVPNFISDYFK